MNNTALKQKIIFRLKNRGCKENEMLLLRFQNTLDDSSEARLLLLEEFLNELDADIFNWLSNKSKLPSRYSSLI